MFVTIYHNPKCSKSRQTLELLKERGVELAIVKYLESPPNLKGLKEILDKLGIPPRKLMRKKESEYTNLKLDDPSLSDKYLIDAMVNHPILIERPIVITKNKARIGRPPEQVLEILE
jgi:arsenate reductase (glutaredoxin)